MIEGKVLKKYEVKAYNTLTHEIVKDIVFAYSQKDLEEKLALLSLVYLSKKELSGSYFLNRRELITFFEVLSDLLSADLSLKIALENIMRTTKNKKLKDVLNEVIKALESGTTFTIALKRLKGLFPDYVLAMIETAEVAGTLQKTLRDIENFYKELDKILSSIKKELVAPLGKIVIIYILFEIFSIFVLPRLLSIDLLKLGVNEFILVVARITQIVAIASFFVFIALSIFSFLLYKTNRRAFEKILRKIPVLSEYFYKRDVFLFYYVLSLLSSEIPLHISLSLVKENLENEKLKKQVEKIVEKLERGEDYIKEFPEMNESYELIIKNAISTSSFEKVFKNISSLALKEFYRKIEYIPVLANFVFYGVGVYVIFLLFFVVVNTYLNALLKIK